MIIKKISHKVKLKVNFKSSWLIDKIQNFVLKYGFERKIIQNAQLLNQNTIN